MQSLNCRGFVENPKRNNLVVYEDAGGYVQSIKAVRNCHLCFRCDTTFDQLAEFQKHCQSEHPDLIINDLADYQEFKGMHIELGNGHLEENIRRNFLNDEIWYSNFVKIMVQSCGFNLQQVGYQVKSHDGHK